MKRLRKKKADAYGNLSSSHRNSNFGFRLHKMPACVVPPPPPPSSAPSCDRAGQTHGQRLHVWRWAAAASSDEFSYWPAETCSRLQKEPHLRSLFFVFLLFLYPVKNKHQNKLTYLSCADPIPNGGPRDAVIPVWGGGEGDNDTCDHISIKSDSMKVRLPLIGCKKSSTFLKVPTKSSSQNPD